MSFLMVLLGIGQAFGATLVVNPSACLSPGIACTITEALEVATNGDVIRFDDIILLSDSPGYQDSVVIDGNDVANITIESAFGSDITVWRAESSGGFVVRVINGAQLTLRGFTMQDGTDSCVRVDEGSLVAEDMVFRYCTATTQGGAIRAVGSDLTVSDSFFYQNTAPSRGGSIFHQGRLGSVETLLVQNSEFIQSTVTDSVAYGGAISAIRVDNVVLDGVEAEGNGATLGGGALAVEEGDVVSVTNSRMENNLASFTPTPEEVAAAEDGEDDEGGIDDASDELIAFLYGEGRGGAMYVQAESLDLSRSLMCANRSVTGGGLYVDDLMDVNIENSIFAQNIAGSYGGGLTVVVEQSAAGQPSITNNTFVGNSAGSTSGVAGGGGAVAAEGTLLAFRNNIVYSSGGGGVSAVEGVNYVLGDAIDFEYNLFNINNDILGPESHFVGSLATYAVSFSNVTADPQLAFYGPDFDCYSDAFHPRWGSPVVDRGDPDIVDAIPQRLLPDGTLQVNRSDIGAFGGPNADVLDRDGDTYENIFDCLDVDETVHPLAGDACDGFDNDCDGVIDEDDLSLWFPDGDADGYGDAGVLVPEFDCTDRSILGWAPNNLDCDDTMYDVNPGEPEVCDDKDNDCNGIVDDPDLLVFETWTRDADGDGYGGPESGRTIDCESPGDDWRLEGGDCDDTDDEIRPGAGELCDGLDNDCNGLVDDEPTDPAAMWYADLDGDGVGTGEATISCESPTEGLWSNYGGDCDDADPNSFPPRYLLDGTYVEGGTDVCDGIDNDCSGTADDDQDEQIAFYPDTDEDGYGDESNVTYACESPGEGYVRKGGDCDDDNLTVGECVECGCQSAPSSGHLGMFGWVAALLLRRRRR